MILIGAGFDAASELPNMPAGPISSSLQTIRPPSAASMAALRSSFPPAGCTFSRPSIVSPIAARAQMADLRASGVAT